MALPLGLPGSFSPSTVPGAAAGCFSKIGRRVSLTAVCSSSVSTRLMNFAPVGPFSMLFTLEILQMSVPTLNGKGNGAILEAMFRLRPGCPWLMLWNSR
jgi:hypothetical protein